MICGLLQPSLGSALDCFPTCMPCLKYAGPGLNLHMDPTPVPSQAWNAWRDLSWRDAWRTGPAVVPALAGATVAALQASPCLDEGGTYAHLTAACPFPNPTLSLHPSQPQPDQYLRCLILILILTLTKTYLTLTLKTLFILLYLTVAFIEQ